MSFSTPCPSARCRPAGHDPHAGCADAAPRTRR
jgi:hypothetical protein